MNKQSSEARMINRFKEIFGKPEDVVIGFGDWEQQADEVHGAYEGQGF